MKCSYHSDLKKGVSKFFLKMDTNLFKGIGLMGMLVLPDLITSISMKIVAYIKSLSKKNFATHIYIVSLMNTPSNFS